MAGFGGTPYSTPEQRTLTSIADDDNQKTPASAEEISRMLQTHQAQIRYLAANQKQLQKGINEATQNPIQQLQQFVSDLIVLFGGGQLAQGVLDFGDLTYILPALGALFGFGDGPFPLNLIAAAEKFFFGYVVPTQAWTDLLNHFIGTWMEAFGIDAKFVTDVKDLVTAVGELFDGVTGLLPNVFQFFDALGITAAGLGPLGLALAPIIKLFEAIDIKKFGNAIEFITDAIDPWIVQLTSIINFTNAVLRILGSGEDVLNSPLPQLTTPWANLIKFLGGINFAITSFNPLTAAQQFIGRLLIPLGGITEVQPDLQLDSGFDESSSLAEDSPAWAPQDLDPLIDYPEGWLWDLIGHTAPGSATVECDGGNHALLGTEIPVVEGQTFAPECWLTWSGVAATGSPFKLQIWTDTGAATDIAAVASPGASGGWTHLSGTYSVPSGVSTIRTRLYVGGGATAGQVWFDDAPIRRTNLMQKGFIEGLVDELAELFGNFAAMIDGILGTGHTFSDLVTFIASGLSLAAQAADNFGELLSGLTLANISALVSFLNTASNNAVDAADAIGDLVAGISGATGILDVVEYLHSIPNTNVIGLLGSVDIGATIQNFADQVYSGLKNLLGTGTSLAQVSGAASNVALAANDAKTIGEAVSDQLARRAISRPSYLAIDPSADAVFNLSEVNGGSLPFVAITQAQSAIGIIGMPDNGNKQSICWLGGQGGLANIDGVFVFLYSIDVTTGEFTLIHASDNIVGDISSSLGWNYYNFPSPADYVDTAQGEWYAVEIGIVGSGTYNVVGKTTAIPDHSSVYPKNLGAKRTVTQPEFDTTPPFGSIGDGGSATNATNPVTSWSHTIAADDNCILIAMTCNSGNGSWSGTSCTVGGVSATWLGNVYLGQYWFGYANVGVFILLDPPTGTKTVQLSNTGSTLYVTANSVTYKHVGSYAGISNANNGNTTSINHSVNSNVGQKLVEILHAQSGLSTFNRTRRVNSGNLQVLDADGASPSVAFTATQPNNPWGSQIVTLYGEDLSAPDAIAAPTYSTSVPWFALCGAAGVSQHAPETAEFESAGSGQTYNVPEWAVEGDLFDIVGIGGGGGGQYGSLPGGDNGNWAGITLEYGVDIPTSTTSFTVNVGAGGAGATNSGENPGQDGADTSVVITGYGTAIAGATGGAGGGSDYSPSAHGDTPGNFTFNGVLYYGGAVAITPSAGNPPGGGGSRRNTGNSTPNNGAAGAVYITCYQP